MKTQISRDTFDTEQRYSGVYLQQGRMILDADWNELTDIEKRRLTDALKDAISGTNKSGGAIAGGAPRVGGLKAKAGPADASGKTILIDPGTLYVDGIPARMANSDAVAANAQPDYPYAAGYTGTNQILYADVWERTVTALHDTAPLSDGGEMRASSLMDAGLHGADTATRTQTMLQVKWCASSKDPLDKTVNPRRGNAKLHLKLRAITSSGDTCDPCASQVEVDERIGNYLFRVEVHDYVDSVLTLKWSRDNGSEACATAALPSGFDKGDWVWEFFDDDTEKLLGNHLTHTKDWLCEYFACNTVNQDNLTWSASPTKVRGVILETCTIPDGNNAPKDYVRQWDGYIRIDLSDPDNANKLSGRDRGVDLVLGTDESQGRVTVQDGVLHINLELMELELITTDATYVPGDYWQAAVREAEQESGDIVLNQATPTGILHHYLYLAELQADKTLKSEDNAFARRMAFPPLTDLTAPDVGYLLPACSGNTVRQQLNSILSVFPGTTVADILNTLLCNLTALSLPYNVSCPSDSLVTNVGIVGTDDTVGEVLNKLLCNLDANTLPYAVTCPSDPLVLKVGIGGADDTIGEVLTKLLCNLDANTLPYAVTCPSDPLVLKVGIGGADDTIGEVLTKLLCNLDANTLPYAVSCPSGPLVTKVGIVSTDDTVGEVLNKLLCNLTSLALPHTVTCPSGALATKLGVISADDTVGEVLEKLLCNLTSLTLPHTVTCPSGALATKLGVNSADDTVGEVLNKLLCNLDASTLPLDKGETLCSDLTADGVNTVQDALNVLCGKSGSGCAVVATSSTHLQTLLEDFANASSEKDLWICLKAGTYTVDASPDGKPVINITGKNSLRITGQGQEAAIINLSGGSLAVLADEVVLENVNITFAADSQLAMTCKRAEAHGCYFKRVATAQDTAAMLSLSTSSACLIDWRGNNHYAVASVVNTEVTTRWAEEDIVGNKTLSVYLLRMENALVAGNLTTYETNLSYATSTLYSMNLASRTAWDDNLGTLNYPSSLEIIKRTGVQPGITQLRSALTATKPTSLAIKNALRAASSMRTRVYDDNALHLISDDIGGSLDSNQLDGWLLFGSTATGYAVPAGVNSVASTLTGSLVTPSGSELRLTGNHVKAIKTSLPTTAFSGSQLITKVTGLTRLSLTDNVIEDDANTMAASTLLVNGNTWKGSDSNLGGAVTDRAVLTGNLVDDDQDYSQFSVTIQYSKDPPQMMEGNNLLFTVIGVR